MDFGASTDFALGAFTAFAFGAFTEVALGAVTTALGDFTDAAWAQNPLRLYPSKLLGALSTQWDPIRPGP